MLHPLIIVPLHLLNFVVTPVPSDNRLIVKPNKDAHTEICAFALSATSSYMELEDPTSSCG